MLLRVAERRGLSISDRDRRRIAEETDLDRLERWFDTAVTAESAAEIFEPA